MGDGTVSGQVSIFPTKKKNGHEEEEFDRDHLIRSQTRHPGLSYKGVCCIRKISLVLGIRTQAV